MKKKNGVVVAIVGILVIVGAGWLLLGPKADDRTQIKAALESAVKASKEGRPGGVVEYLASHFQVNGVEYNYGPQFANFIHKYHPDITLGDISPVINGDSAVVTTDIQFSVLTKPINVPNVKFTLVKEKGTQWLIIPTKNWKLTGAVAPEEAYKQIVDELSGLDNSVFGGGVW